MGREATKAVGNVWYEARKRAAEYDDRLQSREGAAELLGMSVSAVSDTELNITKCMPVDKAVLMADLYNAPELLNHYCLHECPIGCGKPIADKVGSLESVAIRLMSDLDGEKVNKFKRLILEVAAVGEISVRELDKVKEMVEYIDKLSMTISEFKLLAERAQNDR